MVCLYPKTWPSGQAGPRAARRRGGGRGRHLAGVRRHSEGGPAAGALLALQAEGRLLIGGGRAHEVKCEEAIGLRRPCRAVVYGAVPSGSIRRAHPEQEERSGGQESHPRLKRGRQIRLDCQGLRRELGGERGFRGSHRTPSLCWGIWGRQFEDAWHWCWHPLQSWHMCSQQLRVQRAASTIELLRFFYVRAIMISRNRSGSGCGSGSCTCTSNHVGSCVGAACWPG